MKLKLGSVVIGLLLLYLLPVVFVSNNININTCRIVYSLESRKVGSNCKRERELSGIHGGIHRDSLSKCSLSTHSPNLAFSPIKTPFFSLLLLLPFFTYAQLAPSLTSSLFLSPRWVYSCVTEIRLVFFCFSHALSLNCWS